MLDVYAVQAFGNCTEMTLYLNSVVKVWHVVMLLKPFLEINSANPPHEKLHNTLELLLHFADSKCARILRWYAPI